MLLPCSALTFLSFDNRFVESKMLWTEGVRVLARNLRNGLLLWGKLELRVLLLNRIMKVSMVECTSEVGGTVLMSGARQEICSSIMKTWVYFCVPFVVLLFFYHKLWVFFKDLLLFIIKLCVFVIFIYFFIFVSYFAKYLIIVLSEDVFPQNKEMQGKNSLLHLHFF